MYKPEFVYKYCNAERAIDVIENLHLYFAQSSQLNDLYEFRTRGIVVENSETALRLFAKRMEVEGLSPEDALEAAREMTDTDSMKDLHREYMDQFWLLCDQLKQHSGISCFSAVAHNQRMWATYGSNHAGAMIEFTTEESCAPFLNHLSPVLYADSSPKWCPSMFLVLDNGLLRFDERMLSVLLCTKHRQWEHEFEWRLLLLAASPQHPDSRLYRFARQAITRIFIGPNISQSDEQALRAVADTRDIPVFKRIIDPDYPREEFFGIERINSSKQLEYWSKYNLPKR